MHFHITQFSLYGFQCAILLLYKAARAAIPATGMAQRNARPAVGSAPLFDEDPELAAEAVGEAPVLLADVPPVVPAVDPDLAVVEL